MYDYDEAPVAKGDSPTSQPSIITHLAAVEDEVERIHEQIMKLHERLGPVVKPMPEPGGVDKQSKPHAVNSAVSDRLVILIEQCARAKYRIRELTASVDL